MNDGMTDDKPARVPAKANQRWIWPSAIDWTGTESPAGTLGERTQSGSSSKEPPLTGEPDAGDPHVRFGGRGKVLSLVPTLSCTPWVASAPVPNPEGWQTVAGGSLRGIGGQRPPVERR